MADWDPQLDNLLASFSSDPYWETCIRETAPYAPKPLRALHLAILVEPYLSYLLAGKKTVESRFSAVRCAPFGCIEQGDIVLLKQSGGPIVGICEISMAWCYRLDGRTWESIRKDFTDALCAQDPNFWIDREGSLYATLMRIERVKTIEPFLWAKEDRRGWVVLAPRTFQLSLEMA